MLNRSSLILVLIISFSIINIIRCDKPSCTEKVKDLSYEQLKMVENATGRKTGQSNILRCTTSPDKARFCVLAYYPKDNTYCTVDIYNKNGNQGQSCSCQSSGA